MKAHKLKINKPVFLLFPLLLTLSSCFGVNADITLNQNGSGTVTLVYRISKSLDSLGKLDGNERWNTIPVGKADFERSLDRLPEIKLLSFSSKEDAKDVIITAKMEFAAIGSLLAFLDASGRRSTFSGDAGSGRLALTLNEGTKNEGVKNENAGLTKLIADISDGYSVRVSVTFPGTGSLALTDSQGKAITTLPGAEFIQGGKTASFDIPLYQVLSSTDGINAVFSW